MSETTRDWIDNSGCFIFGKHEGEMVKDVLSRDPSYLRWVVDEVNNISDGDRRILQNQLDRAGR